MVGDGCLVGYMLIELFDAIKVVVKLDSSRGLQRFLYSYSKVDQVGGLEVARLDFSATLQKSPKTAKLPESEITRALIGPLVPR